MKIEYSYLRKIPELNCSKFALLGGKTIRIYQHSSQPRLGVPLLPQHPDLDEIKLAVADTDVLITVDKLENVYVWNHSNQEIIRSFHLERKPDCIAMSGKYAVFHAGPILDVYNKTGFSFASKIDFCGLNYGLHDSLTFINSDRMILTAENALYSINPAECDESGYPEYVQCFPELFGGPKGINVVALNNGFIFIYEGKNWAVFKEPSLGIAHPGESSTSDPAEPCSF